MSLAGALRLTGLLGKERENVPEGAVTQKPERRVLSAEALRAMSRDDLIEYGAGLGYVTQQIDLNSPTPEQRRLIQNLLTLQRQIESTSK